LAAAVGYPPAFLAAYFLDLAVPYGTIAHETNVTQPVIPVLAVLLAAVVWLRYRLWRVLRRRLRPDAALQARQTAIDAGPQAGPQAATDAWDRFCLAHRPAALCLPLTLPLCVLPMEGNAFGLLVLPLLLALTLSIGVWVQVRLWRRAPG
jgi:hypothetical protein